MNAVQAGVYVAEQFGLRVDEAVLLRSTNNVVAWLRPLPVVVKIGTGHQSGLATEVRVAAELSALDAPVVGPAPEIPAVVHALAGFSISFWRYHPQPPDVEIAAGRVSAALHRLHAAAAQLSEELRAGLPSYLDELISVRALLGDAQRLRALPAKERHLLVWVFDRLWKQLQLASPAGVHTVIHGSPHPYNVLLVAGEPSFIDFETTCIGPSEWDLAHMSPEAATHYAGGTDAPLLQACRDMVRVKTAAWCWADQHRGDLRYHAETHTAYLRETFAALMPA